MTERENTPGSPCPPLKFSQHDLELDKSADGRYWRLLHWTNDGVLLQLRIVHSTVDDPNDFIAEMKRIEPDHDPGGRSEAGFVPLGRFFFSPFELEEPEPDLTDFPDAYRAEFVTMVWHLRQVLTIMECGAALGESSIE